MVAACLQRSWGRPGSDDDMADDRGVPVPDHGLPVSAHHLILYDGVCGLCNGLVQFVLARDPWGVFHFASLQSEQARRILAPYGRDAADLDTFYVLTGFRTDGAQLLEKSTAALFVLQHLGGPWRWARFLRNLPFGLRDWVYDRVARNRYRLFGRQETCPLPTPEVRSRFLDL
jgi:predicted DCC family thiol-disulfide oxidoreductase YuxK